MAVPSVHIAALQDNACWVPAGLCENLDQAMQQTGLSRRYALKTIG
jgi:hypothetical protein